METVQGYASTSWEGGYGDYTMIPDLSTLRPSALARGNGLCAVRRRRPPYPWDVPHSPRAVLKKQIARLEQMGMKAYMASELEFFLFDQTYEERGRVIAA